MTKYFIETTDRSIPVRNVTTTVKMPSLFRTVELKYCAPIKYKIINEDGHLMLLYFDYFPSDDNHLLVLIDLKKKTERFRLSEFHYSYNERFRFSKDNTYIICDTGVCELNIDFYGVIANECEYYEKCIEKAFRVNPYIVKRFYDSYGENEKSWRKVLACMNNIVTEQKKTHMAMLDVFYRIQGDCHYKLNDKKAALQSYVNALHINSKVGVKRRVREICRELNISEYERERLNIKF